MLAVLLVKRLVILIKKLTSRELQKAKDLVTVEIEKIWVILNQPF